MHSLAALTWAVRAIAASLAGMALMTILCQIPVTHHIDVGRFDAAYVRGFYDPERLDLPQARAYLHGSDGSARWTRAESYLLLPQAGLPAEVTIRLRGWRADGALPDIAILVDGHEVYAGATTGEWQEVRIPLRRVSLKPEDVLITVRSGVAPVSAGDPRLAGVLVDTVVYRTAQPPLQPYPAQMAWGALAGGLLFLALTGVRGGGTARLLRLVTPLRAWLVGMLLIGALYLFFYRIQPAYPYPLRGLLPGVCAALGAIVTLRYGPALAARLPVLPDVLAVSGIAVWTTAVLLAAQDHVTLAVPGVEKDFRVFATRAVDLTLVMRADGFYNLGYPFLLWLFAPLTGGNSFLAARLIAALAGMLLLGAAWWLARCLLGRAPALAALVVLGLNPFVVQYALYVGSDMPFAALCTLALALLASHRIRGSLWLAALAGGVAGCAFLVRHPGILLLPFGVFAFLWMRHEAREARGKPSTFHALVFAFAFSIAAAPQMIVNLRDTGQPLYNQQAKNVWLAVYGDSDWGRWNEVSNDVSLTDVILEDPGRFAGAWWTHLRAFIGSGAETADNVGRASQLRLLAFPANWLAVIGLAGWLAILVYQGRKALFRSHGAEEIQPSPPPFAVPLLIWVTLYTLALAVGLPLQRFFLPLAPVYALAAAWTLLVIIRALARQRTLTPVRLQIGVILILLLVSQSGFALGVRDVIDRQPADEVAAVRLVQQTLPPEESLRVVLAPGDPVGKYSAIAHRVAPPGRAMRYLLHSAEAGALPDGMVVAAAGKYALVRIEP
ncbi:MAG: glycosyltransferase family 39 protein [Roseiflexus sp.]|uniref:glycosyltransferase family 39 protein n=1 Tax=Roseiflexus sp. TaxID=2562120 RepID=UPI0025EE5C60|nr:glycosyltransferase family 39 protein [Roseiflexus sp.]MCL6540142.1 glycosyltransferase family 39 protein [Roseiflexus sp.]